MSDSARPVPPVFFRRLGTDEYEAPPLTEWQRRAARKVVARGSEDAARIGLSLGDYWSGRMGTDATWYGSTQPIIDALRVFQIPDELCAKYGYPKMTPAICAKILGRNAARFYDLDLGAVRTAAMTGELAWVRQAVREGMPIR